MLAETRLLKPVSKSTVPARTKPWSAAEFYQTGHGLYVHDTFIDRLNLSISQIGDSTLERPYIASLLKVNAYDKDIREELPKTHLSTLEDIAYLIEAQSNGQSGFLLNRGYYTNIFYVEGKNSKVLAVGVSWDSSNCDWNVYSWKLGEGGYWPTENQVLCPGIAAL